MTSSPTNRKALVLIALVLLLGIALGAVSHSLFDRHVLGARTQFQPQPRPNPPRAVARLTNELNLTPEQQKEIGEILADVQRRFDAVHDQINPQLYQVREEGRDKIRQVLTPEQRPKFEDYLRRLDEERRRRTANPNAGPNPNSNR